MPSRLLERGYDLNNPSGTLGGQTVFSNTVAKSRTGRGHPKDKGCVLSNKCTECPLAKKCFTCKKPTSGCLVCEIADKCSLIRRNNVKDTYIVIKNPIQTDQYDKELDGMKPIIPYLLNQRKLSFDIYTNSPRIMEFFKKYGLLVNLSIIDKPRVVNKKGEATK